MRGHRKGNEFLNEVAVSNYRRAKRSANPVRRLWFEIEDYLAPYRRLEGWEKGLYYHLLRHTRLIGRRKIKVTHRALSRSTGYGEMVIHTRMPRLEQKGLIRTHSRGYHGRVIEVLLPREIPGCVIGPSRVAEHLLDFGNCIKNPILRRAIYERDKGRCFYCLERVSVKEMVLDHATPVADGGDHSYRNVVTCCFPCNSAKAAMPAPQFLRWMMEKGRLSSTEMRRRLRALAELQAGRLRPVLRAA